MGVADWEIAFLGASGVSSTTGVPLWEPYVPLTNDVDDIEPFGPTDVFQSLGVTSLPWPKDNDGYAECIVLRGARPVCIGARDTRTAKIAGNLKPGDTVVHSTGPQQSAQLQLKEEKRQAVLTTKDSRGKDMALVLDGKNDKGQWSVMGHMIEISEDAISIVHKSGAGILIDAGGVHTLGTTTLGGPTPVAPVMAGAAPPGAPSPGVFVGT